MKKIRELLLLEVVSFIKNIPLGGNFKKLSVLLPAAFLSAFVLFYVIALMISKNHDLSLIKNEKIEVEFLMSDRKSKVIEKKRGRVQKKEEVKPPPFQAVKPALSPIPGPAADFDISEMLGGIEGFSSAAPIFQILPEYPPSAQLRGVEGFVVLQFDISEKGSPFNVKVVRAEPPRIFNQSAVRAVLKWKYRPKMENEQAVVQHDIQTMVEFKLEKGEK